MITYIIRFRTIIFRKNLNSIYNEIKAQLNTKDNDQICLVKSSFSYLVVGKIIMLLVQIIISLTLKREVKTHGVQRGVREGRQ